MGVASNPPLGFSERKTTLVSLQGGTCYPQKTPLGKLMPPPIDLPSGVASTLFWTSGAPFGTRGSPMGNAGTPFWISAARFGTSGAPFGTSRILL